MRAFRRAVIPALIGWLCAIAYLIAAGPGESPDSRANVAIVLGAAVDSREPSPVFRERIVHAITLYREGRVERLLFTGGRAEGDSLAESEAAQAMALAAGVPADAILIETVSATTLANLTEAQALMRNAGLESALIVSDPLHLRRAMAMADALEIDAQPSATPTTRYRTWSTKAPFLAREVYFMHHFWLLGE